MPIIEYKGQQQEFPDSWSDEKIRAALSGEFDPPGALEDAKRNIPHALARGVAGVAGLPGDVAYGMRWLTDKGRQLAGGEADPQYVEMGRPKGMPDTPFSGIVPEPPTSAAVRGGIESVTGLGGYKPQTRTGKYTGAVAEFLPGALGPGGLVRNALRYAVAPGLASEAAGHATEGSDYEPYARVLGGLAGLGGANYLSRPNAGPRAVSQALRGVGEQDIADAGRLMMEARVRGIELTWPEAIDQVTNGRSSLGNLQRVVEASPGGSEVMRPFMAERPAQVERAFNNQMGDIAAVPMTPSQIGPRASEAASGIIEGVRRRINARTTPDYTAARADTVPDRTLQRLHRSVPGFTQALEHVRTQPNWAAELQGLPDNSVIVLDAVKRRMQQTAENMGAATNPDRDLFVASSQRRASEAVDRAARRASRPYRRALDEQSRARGAELEPLQQSPVGRISDAGDTRAAQQALLPDRPQPGSAAETGRATRQMVQADPTVTRNLVRTRLESTYNAAARDLQGGPSEFAGAAARARLVGDRQMRRNIRAALSELPNGARISEGFDTLMNIFQATGRRQRIGSQTAFNQEYQRMLQGGGLTGESFTGMRRAIRERYQQWRLGRNLDELARLLTDQGAQQRLMELARMRYADPRSWVLAEQLLVDMSGGTGGN
jgi:hypothetical protein